MKKLILMVQNFFEDRDYKRYGIEIFKENGIEVEVWSMVYLVTTSKRVVSLQKLTDRIEVIYPKTKQELKEKIQQSKQYEFLLNLNFFDKSMEIRKEIYGNKCNYYELKICAPLMYSEEFQRQNIFGKLSLLRKIENKTWKESAEFLFREYASLGLEHVNYRVEMYRNQPQAVFVSTKYEKCHLPFEIRKCKQYKIHTLDYDIFLENQEENEKAGEDYIVYIDDAETINQADGINYGETPITTMWKTTHRKDLCNLFDKVEKIYKKKIVIAGHPRVRYEGNEYGNRKIIQFQTGKLVKDTSMVIVSRSTAWNFIVLYDKPVLFYTTSRKPYKEDITIMEYYYKRKAIDIAGKTVTKKYILAHTKRINEKQRLKYLREYVLGEVGNNTYFFQTVADIIRKQ